MYNLKSQDMKAFIIYKGSDKSYCGFGVYSLVTEDGKEIGLHTSSSRSFANHDLTEWRQKELHENEVTEVYSNGVLVWQDGDMTEDTKVKFAAANYEYEREYCNV